MGNNENKSDIDNNFEKHFSDEVQSEKGSYLYEIYPSFSYNINQSLDLPETSLDDQIKKDLFENSQKAEENKKKIFNVIHPKNIPISNFSENESGDESLNSGISMLKSKRFDTKRRRRENSDNIRKKIKVGFFNRTLINKLNIIIKSNGSRFYFTKFPQKFISNISKNANKKLLNMTLLEIFETSNIYSDSELNNFLHNYQVIEKKEIKENIELEKILNKKCCELFKEYINSKEFKIDEINRLKKKFDKSYIERYIFLSKHFIEFFAN